MPAASATRVLRLLALIAILSLSASATAGCDTVNGLLPGGGEPEEEVTLVATDHGPCLPTYGDEVRSASMSLDGSRILFISEERPATLHEDESWSSDDRAIYVLNLSGEGATQTNVIATTWPAPADSEIPAAATPDEFGDVPEPGRLEEQMLKVQLAGSGDRFVVAAARQGSSGMVKLYSGMVPEGDAELAPDDGLALVPINDTQANQFIRYFRLTPDGLRVAAVVGGGGDIRVYDFDSDTIWVYEIDEDGETVVSHDLPPAQTSIDDDFSPAIGSGGSMHLAWAPDGRRIAFSRPESVGTAGVWILDTDSGETTFVRGYRNTTVPWVSWAADGQSLFVMSTAFDTAQTFGDSELRRVAAEANGADIGDRWKLEQDMFYNTSPANLIGYGDDSSFLFLWEHQVWLMEVPASGTGPAVYGPVTHDAPSSTAWKDGQMAVQSGSLSVSPVRYSAAFVVSDRAGLHVGQRLHVLEQDCPLEPVPVEGEDAAGAEDEDGTADEGASQDAAEGEAAENEAAEGDAAENEAAEGDAAEQNASQDAAENEAADEQAEDEGEAEEEAPTEDEEGEGESEESEQGSDG